MLARRIELAKRIGEVKSKGSLPIDNEKVEDALLGGPGAAGECKGLGLDQQLGTKILSTLLKESKKAQRTQAGGKQQALITPMVMMAKATEIEKGGKKLIRLDVGEPDFRPPKAVLDAVSNALYSYKTYYTVGRGIPELLSRCDPYLAIRYNYREAAENQLIVTPGGRFAVYSALATVASEGDSVVVIEPNWPAYKEGLDYIGARAITVRTTMEERWEPSPERVKAAIRPNTKAIVLSYPSNPTGKIMDKASFKEIVEIADDRGLTVISDEIYNDYAYKPCPTILDDLPKKYILTSSFSKAWSMTGFRVGYSFAPPETSSRMLKVLGLMITCVPDFIQRGAVKALEAVDEVSRNSRIMKERIDATSAELAGDRRARADKARGGDLRLPAGQGSGVRLLGICDGAPREEGCNREPRHGVRRLPEVLQDLARPAARDPIGRRQEDRRTAQLKVAVLGARGGMGSFFVRYFLEKGETVRGSDPGRGGKRAPASDARRFASFKTNVEAARGCDVDGDGRPHGEHPEGREAGRREPEAQAPSSSRYRP